MATVVANYNSRAALVGFLEWPTFVDTLNSCSELWADEFDICNPCAASINELTEGAEALTLSAEVLTAALEISISDALTTFLASGDAKLNPDFTEVTEAAVAEAKAIVAPLAEAEPSI